MGLHLGRSKLSFLFLVVLLFSFFVCVDIIRKVVDYSFTIIVYVFDRCYSVSLYQYYFVDFTRNNHQRNEWRQRQDTIIVNHYTLLLDAYHLIHFASKMSKFLIVIFPWLDGLWIEFWKSQDINEFLFFVPSYAAHHSYDDRIFFPGRSASKVIRTNENIIRLIDDDDYDDYSSIFEISGAEVWNVCPSFVR